MSSERRAEAQASTRAGRPGVARALVAAALAVAALPPLGALAHETGDQNGAHTLEVVLAYPDSGLAEGEQLCLGLYPGDATDFSAPPLQARCLDPGQSAATFEGIAHGEFVVAVPSAGSEIEADRYQGQLVATALPDEPDLAAYGIEVDLALAPEVAGTTGRVQVNVYGCPPGTDGGGDAEFWASECQALAGGIPLSLSGVGTIEHTAIEATTGETGLTSGRALFTNLPAGAYKLDGKLPGSASVPAVFIQSSIEGGVRPVDGGTLDLRPTETVAVDVYLVLDGQDTATVETPAEAAPTTILGFGDQRVTGGLPTADVAAPEAGEIQE
jgi:hypothetical protein